MGGQVVLEETEGEEEEIFKSEWGGSGRVVVEMEVVVKLVAEVEDEEMMVDEVAEE